MDLLFFPQLSEPAKPESKVEVKVEKQPEKKKDEPKKTSDDDDSDSDSDMERVGEAKVVDFSDGVKPNSYFPANAKQMFCRS